MRLGELVNKIGTCCACISITGLCDEYRDGLENLRKEPWYKEARGETVKGISIIGFEEYSFELCIRI